MLRIVSIAVLTLSFTQVAAAQTLDRGTGDAASSALDPPSWRRPAPPEHVVGKAPAQAGSAQPVRAKPPCPPANDRAGKMNRPDCRHRDR